MSGKISKKSFIIQNETILVNCLKYISDNYKDRQLQIDIKDYTKKRNTDQNAKYWAMLGELAEHINDNKDEYAKFILVNEYELVGAQKTFIDLHWRAEHLHEIIKTECEIIFKARIVTLKGVNLYMGKSSTELTTVEFAELIEWVILWAGETFGYVFIEHQGSLNAR